MDKKQDSGLACFMIVMKFHSIPITKEQAENLRQHRIYSNKGKGAVSSKLNTQKYIYFSSAGHSESSRQRFPVSQIQIRQCEHDIQFGGLFSQTSISCFSISE